MKRKLSSARTGFNMASLNVADIVPTVEGLLLGVGVIGTLKVIVCGVPAFKYPDDGEAVYPLTFCTEKP